MMRNCYVARGLKESLSCYEDLTTPFPLNNTESFSAKPTISYTTKLLTPHQRRKNKSRLQASLLLLLKFHDTPHSPPSAAPTTPALLSVAPPLRRELSPLAFASLLPPSRLRLALPHPPAPAATHHLPLAPLQVPYFCVLVPFPLAGARCRRPSWPLFDSLLRLVGFSPSPTRFCARCLARATSCGLRERSGDQL